MKKLLLSTVFVIALWGCSKNPIVGTWQDSSSKEDNGLAIAVGGINTYTYESNGDYHSNFEIQAKLGEKSASVTMEVKGKWEMVDDTHFRVITSTATISGEEMENITDETYTIITIDEEMLETMNRGIKKTYKRIK